MEQFYKQDEDVLERIERLEDSLAKREYEIDIKIKENEELREEFINFTDNPIRYELIRLLRDDVIVERSINLSIENEVDNQCMGLKAEILEDLDYKIDEQFDGNAFKSAVDDHLRSKFS